MIKIAKNIIKKCGGHKTVADWLEIDVSNVYRLTYPKDKGGTGGFRNTDQQDILLKKAKENNISLERSDFFKAV